MGAHATLSCPAAVNAALFCGYRQASGSCGRRHPEAEEYPAAFDWRDSGPSRAAFRVWLNTTTDSSNNGAPVVPLRVLKPFDLALQSWLKTHLGPEYSATTVRAETLANLPAYSPHASSQVLGQPHTADCPTIRRAHPLSVCSALSAGLCWTLLQHRVAWLGSCEWLSLAGPHVSMTHPMRPLFRPQLYIKEMPKGASDLRLDFSSLLGPLFFLWVLGLPFPGEAATGCRIPTQARVPMLVPLLPVGAGLALRRFAKACFAPPAPAVMLLSLVYEKENRLRIMMKMHGLSDNSYWMVSYMWWIMITIIYSLFLLIFGNIINLNFFRDNDFGIKFIFVIAAQHAQVATAFLLSSVFKSSRTATIFGYIWILGSGIFAANIMSTFIDEARKWVPAIELIPTFGIYRGLYEMSQYAFRGQYRGGKGLTWSNLSDPNNGMGRVMGVFMLEFFVAMPLAWYLEQASGGVREWRGRRGHCCLGRHTSVPTFSPGPAGGRRLHGRAPPLALLPATQEEGRVREGHRDPHRYREGAPGRGGCHGGA